VDLPTTDSNQVIMERSLTNSFESVFVLLLLVGASFMNEMSIEKWCNPYFV